MSSLFHFSTIYCIVLYGTIIAWTGELVKVFLTKLEFIANFGALKVSISLHDYRQVHLLMNRTIDVVDARRRERPDFERATSN